MTGIITVSRHYLCLFHLVFLVLILVLKTDAFDKINLRLSAMRRMQSVPTPQHRQIRTGICDGRVRSSSSGIHDLDGIPNVMPGEKLYRNYQNEASKMFESYRIPAMLISGAAYSGAFALPLSKRDSLSMQLIKRTHCVLGIATLLACLITVVLSTSVIDKISVGKHTPLASSLREYLDQNFEFEWVSVRANFIAGIFGFATMCGLRSSSFLTCPQFSRATRYLYFFSTSITLKDMNVSISHH